MNYMVRFQINIFALMILLVLYLFIRGSKVKSFSKSLIQKIFLVVAISIINEPLAWMLDGAVFRGGYIFTYLSSTLLYFIGPVIAGLLFSYIDYRAFRNPKRLQKKFYYQHLSLVVGLGLLVNTFFPFLFHVDPVTNVYTSNPAVRMIHHGLMMGFYLYMLVFLYQVRAWLDTIEISLYVLTFALPVLGMIGALLEPTLHLTWVSVVVGFLAIYVFLETTPSDEDYLTKVYNRKNYEIHLDYLVETEMPFGLFIFDLNDFKAINDDHGHHKGDEVLVAFADALKEVFQKVGLVARLGGDEFAVILEKNLEDPEVYVSELRLLLKIEKDPLLKKLTFGYGFVLHEKPMTLNELYHEADTAMYRYKEEIKGQKKEAKRG